MRTVYYFLASLVCLVFLIIYVKPIETVVGENLAEKIMNRDLATIMLAIAFFGCLILARIEELIIKTRKK